MSIGRWPRRRLLLTVVGVLSASTSIVGLFLYGAHILPLYFFIDSLAAPSLITILVLGIFSRRIDEKVFLNRLVVGSWLGIVATVAYDAARLPIWISGAFNPYFTILQFGQIITGDPTSSFAATVVGWLYHYWNGFGFGVIYTLVVGTGEVVLRPCVGALPRGRLASGAPSHPSHHVGMATGGRQPLRARGVRHGARCRLAEGHQGLTRMARCFKAVHG